MSPIENKQFVINHFDALINHRDLAALDRNLKPDFYDHDGPGGKPGGVEENCAMIAGLYQAFPDLQVEVLEAVAEADKVIVRNCWTGTNTHTGKRMEFHGFVLWRLEDGKIAERWATVTPPQESIGTPVW